MTKQEAAVVSAYTGVMVGSFSDLHQLIEGLLDRPVFTHELANKELVSKIKTLAKPYFMAIAVN